MSEATISKYEEELENFLKVFSLKGSLKYRERLSLAAAENKKSLVVDFDDLLSFNIDLANRLIKEPDSILPAFDMASYQALRYTNPDYAEQFKRDGFKVRIRNLPEKLSVRQVGSKDIDKLVSVSGMVVRTSELKPLMVRAAFRCLGYNHLSYVKQTGTLLKKPTLCPECNDKRLELDVKSSEFIDYQILRIQELPEELPPGQLPQSFDVGISGDVVGLAKPGDRVIVNGIVRTDPEFAFKTSSSRLFRLRIEGNYIEILGKELELFELTKEDEEEIKKLALNPNIYERLIQSIAPSIHGYETQKEAILLQLVGSPQLTLPDGVTLRGDINILLVGDPGTAKSELLKYVVRVAPRGLYTSGKGSTAAGLTAAVIREKSGVMMLEAGAVVLADQGIACIDEFDKMRPEDRSALHEAMEQQTVSVAKGGIVTTLNSRTSILAAANPVFGKYEPRKNITDNINIPIPLLTRFDLIFILRDIPDRPRDEKLARFLLEQHRKGTYPIEPLISFDMLRKYIAYAKRINPSLTKEAEDKLLEYYLQLRGSMSDDMISVTPRQLESLIRLAKARARLFLRDKVTEEDALRSISLMRKMLETVGIDVKTGKVDMGVLHGKPLSERSQLMIAVEVFKNLEGPQKNPVEDKVFIQALVDTKRFTEEEAKRMLRNLIISGQIYESKPGYYNKL
ncbi:MAG: minichromosome maintenance protein MCM [Nitrososphaerales archaeon]